MARRKRTRLTRKKSDKTLDKVTPGGLSARSFAALANGYESFQIEDTSHASHTFNEGDLAYIQHQDLDDSEVVPDRDYWIGRIAQIRGNDHDDVWVRVQWFWSPEEVAGVIKSFDRTICGRYEKLWSDTTDIISVHCFVACVDVKIFNETSIEQPFIRDDEWFVRFKLQYSGKRLDPKVAHSACPICKIPYIPGEEKILHFCPRRSCSKFYHQSCLVKNNYVEDTRTHRVLETWPNVNRSVSVEELCGVCPPKKRQKMDGSMSETSYNDVFEQLPSQLIAIADQQIVRGVKGGGLVGNITRVAKARQLIYDALSGEGIIPDNWETAIDTSAAFSGPETGTFPNCICPNCYSPI